MHPSYSDRTLKNDIAILVVSRRFNFNRSAREGAFTLCD